MSGSPTFLIMENTPYTAAVARPFEVYNSIFLTLPLGWNSGNGCAGAPVSGDVSQGLGARQLAAGSGRGLFQAGGRCSEDQTGVLFRFIQYIERQVVLVDALEDARYERLNDLQGAESLAGLLPRIERREFESELKAAMAEQRVRIVLTAHPTQFYPGSALGIITDLTEVMRQR